MSHLRRQFWIWTYTQSTISQCSRQQPKIQSSPKRLCTPRSNARKPSARASRCRWVRRRATAFSTVRTRPRRTGWPGNRRDAPSWSLPANSPGQTWKTQPAILVTVTRATGRRKAERNVVANLVFVGTRVGRRHQPAVHLGVQTGRRVLAVGADLGDERGFGDDHGVGGRVRFYGVLTAGDGGRRHRAQRNRDEDTANGLHFFFYPLSSALLDFTTTIHTSWRYSGCDFWTIRMQNANERSLNCNPSVSTFKKKKSANSRLLHSGRVSWLRGDNGTPRR